MNGALVYQRLHPCNPFQSVAIHFNTFSINLKFIDHSKRGGSHKNNTTDIYRVEGQFLVTPAQKLLAITQQTIRLRLRSTDKPLVERERCIGFKGATFRNSSSSVEEYLTKTSSENTK